MSYKSPKFNEKIDIVLILVKTDYNSRIFDNKDNMDKLRMAMDSFNDFLIPNTCTNPEKGCKIIINKKQNLVKSGKIYKIPSFSNLDFLYAYDEKIFRNNDNNLRIDKIRSYLNKSKINDEGCFVFEIKSLNDITFGDILKSLVNEMTRMDFCAAFDIRWLYDVQYYKKQKVIVFKFETESG